MTANIETFGSVGQRRDVWHTLGNYTEEHPEFAGRTALTWEEMVKFAGLDWRVIKQPNYSRRPTGKGCPENTGTVMQVNSFTVFRDKDGQELGTVGPDYTVKQNEDCFKFVDTLLEANGGSHYDTAGALGNGAIIWVAVRVPKADIRVMGQDEHQSYLVFATSHDGSMSHTVKLTTVRVVCQNTLNSALHGSGAMLRVKHTAQADARLDRARTLMTGVTVDAKALESKLNTLAQRKMTREAYTAIMDRLFPKPAEENANASRRNNILAEIAELYASNDKGTYSEFAGTAYNLLNAVTEYTDHVRGARITDGRKGMTVERARAENAAQGTGDVLKNKALEYIYEMTDGAPVNRIVCRPMGTGTGADLPTGGGSLLDHIASQN